MIMAAFKGLLLLGTIFASATAFPFSEYSSGSGHGKSTAHSYVTVTKHETSKTYGVGKSEESGHYSYGGHQASSEGGKASSSYGKSDEDSSSYHKMESKGHGGDYHHEEEKVFDYYAKPQYKFEYKIEDPHTGDVKSQKESRDGDKVEGAYELKEPDGTILEVHYVADKKNGFNAEVVRKGKASHPQEYKKHESSKHEYKY